MRCQESKGSLKESAFLGRVSLRFRWKKSLLPAGPKSFFHQWLIVYMELRFASVRHSTLWSVSKPRTINRGARMFLSKSDAAHVRDQEYRFETDKWFLDPSEVEYRTSNRVSGEGVSFNPFTRLRFLSFFFFFTLLKFVYIRY